MSLKKPGGSLKVILFSSTQYNSLVVTDEEIISRTPFLPDGSSLADAHVAFRCSYRRIPTITGPLKITDTLACMKFSWEVVAFQI